MCTTHDALPPSRLWLHVRVEELRILRILAREAVGTALSVAVRRQVRELAGPLPVPCDESQGELEVDQLLEDSGK